jgi:hypothetical protein
MARASKRAAVRDEAEKLLRNVGKPLHYSEIAGSVLRLLQPGETMSAKDVNTCLHDDPQRRFIRVKRGTWTCRGSQTTSYPP